MITHLIKLDLDSPALQHTSIVLNQANKDSVTFNIKVYKDEAEIDYSLFEHAELVFMKPDKSNVVDDAILTDTGLTYNLNAEIYPITGQITGYVNLYSSNAITTSLHYSFMIISDLINADKISGTYVSAIEHILSDIEAIQAEAQEILDGLQSGVPWSLISNTPNTLSGYGIVDAMKIRGSLPAESTNITDIFTQPSGYYIIPSESISGMPSSLNFTFGVLWLKGDWFPVSGFLLCSNLTASENIVYQAKVDAGSMGDWETILTTSTATKLLDDKLNELDLGNEFDLGNDYSTIEQPVMIIKDGVSVQMKDTDGKYVYERIFSGKIVAAANTESIIELAKTDGSSVGIQNIISHSGWFENSAALPNRYPLPYYASSESFGMIAFKSGRMEVSMPSGDTIITPSELHLVTKLDTNRSSLWGNYYRVYVRYTK